MHRLHMQVAYVGCISVNPKGRDKNVDKLLPMSRYRVLRKDMNPY